MHERACRCFVAAYLRTFRACSVLTCRTRYTYPSLWLWKKCARAQGYSGNVSGEKELRCFSTENFVIESERVPVLSAQLLLASLTWKLTTCYKVWVSILAFLSCRLNERKLQDTAPLGTLPQPGARCVYSSLFGVRVRVCCGDGLRFLLKIVDVVWSGTWHEVELNLRTCGIV